MLFISADDTQEGTSSCSSFNSCDASAQIARATSSENASLPVRSVAADPNPQGITCRENACTCVQSLFTLKVSLSCLNGVFARREGKSLS